VETPLAETFANDLKTELPEKGTARLGRKHQCKFWTSYCIFAYWPANVNTSFASVYQ
jgi:hypothetical protein